MAPDGVGRLRVLTYNFLCHYDPAIAHPLCIPHSLGLKPETTVCTSRMALGEVKNAQWICSSIGIHHQSNNDKNANNATRKAQGNYDLSKRGRQRRGRPEAPTFLGHHLI